MGDKIATKNIKVIWHRSNIHILWSKTNKNSTVSNRFFYLLKNCQQGENNTAVLHLTIFYYTVSTMWFSFVPFCKNTVKSMTIARSLWMYCNVDLNQCQINLITEWKVSDGSHFLIHRAVTELSKTAFSYFAPEAWNQWRLLREGNGGPSSSVN